MTSERFYNTFSIFYPVVDVFLKAHKQKLLQEINSLPSGRLLEIGVGTGSHLHLYQTHVITAIDTSEKMLAAAKKNNSATIELLHMNGEELLFPDQSFDYVVLSHVIAVVTHPEKLLEEVHRVLKPKGQIFILNHFTPTNALRYIDHTFHAVSKLFHFNAVFYIDRIQAIKKFTLLREIHMNQLSYFKLLIYSKA